MADPAILALLQHLNWSPPAIVQAAPIEMTDPTMRAYARYVDQQEAALASWLERGRRLRADLWPAAGRGDPGLTPAVLTDIITQFEAGLRHQAVTIARKEKQAHRQGKILSGDAKNFVARQHSRLLAIARTFYAEGRDFAAFLQALRAELDPESRGGPTFDDPAALERHLLGQLA